MQHGPVEGDAASALGLAELISTRLCHDLGGPLAGLVAAMSEAGSDPAALDLARDATRQLRQRLALMRAAWGSPGASLAGSEIAALAEGLPHAHRLRLEIASGIKAKTWPPLVARVLLNTLILAAESLPLGGTIALLGSKQDGLLVTLDGKRAAWPSGLGAMLADAAAVWSAATPAQGLAGLRAVQPALTALLAHEAGIQARLLLGGPAAAVPPLSLRLPFSAPA
jgi:histidine phosphotransferase ChpT